MDKKASIQRIYNLTPMQEGILFHCLLDKGSNAYFEQMTLSIAGRLDVELLEKSFNLLIARHEALRTNFVHERVKKPQQVVLKDRTLKLGFEDISGMAEVEKNQYIAELQKNDRDRGFDLLRDLLTRASVIKLGEASYKLVWSHHHIIMDGWCLGFVIKELLQIYMCLVKNKAVDLGSAYPYLNYIKWLENRDKEDALAYWMECLEGYQRRAVLPKCKSVTDSVAYKREEIRFVIDESLTSRLESIASHGAVTINSVLQTAWGVLLQRYNNTEDVVFGSVVSGRSPEVDGIENMVGLFINTVPVRVRSDRNQTFAELVKRVHDQYTSAKEHEYLSLAEIQASTELKQSLIDNILVFENYPVQKEVAEASHSEGMEFTVKGVEMFEQASYDFGIIVVPGKELQIRFNYNASAYTEDFIKNLEGHLKEILKAITANPHMRISEMDILTEGEKRRILQDFNDTYAEVSEDKTIYELFEAQAGMTLDAIALCYSVDSEHGGGALEQKSGREGKREKLYAGLTYGQLNERANQLSRLLRERGVERDSIVGIMTNCPPETAIGILAALKAGGAFLPIDPAYPEERVRYMLEDSGVRVLLTQGQHMPRFAEHSMEMIDLEDQRVYQGDGTNLPKINNGQDLAYVIYTSGTTGKPKGVMIEHRSIYNAIEWRRKEYGLGAGDTVLQLFSFAFDGFVTSFFTPIVSGAKVVMPSDEEIRDIGALRKHMAFQGVTHFTCVPSLYSAILDSIASEEAQSLKIVTLAGERTANNLIEKSMRINPKIELVNEYGPTENSVVATALRNMQHSGHITIGKPIANVRTYIVDRNNNLQPVGIPGELCLEGKGLARGYLKKGKLTEERFVDCKFANHPDGTGLATARPSKMYKTGDMARWLPNGSIDFLGRMDQQVKIRGYRIEPEEVEAEMLALDSVEEVAVVVRESLARGKCLCAYFAARRSMGAEEMKRRLSARLPQYMIPSVFIQLDTMPLTPNGKVDRKALPEPDFEGGRECYEAPREGTEEKLAALWQEMLGVERVGSNDDFFDLGGHSLKATILASRIQNIFKVEVPLKEIFRRKTVRELAKYIDSTEESLCSSIQKVEEREHYPASPAQKRLYIVGQMEGAGSSYNMPSVAILEGSLDAGKLEGIFRDLIKRHEILRTSFGIYNNELIQRVHEHADFNMEYAAAEENELEGMIEQFIQPFDLGRTPLIRAKLVKLSEDRHVLIYDMHHIISDGISQMIFIKETLSLYEGMRLPHLNIQYKDFAVWQKGLFESEVFKKQEAYWLNRFKDKVPVLDIPLDYPRPAVQSFEGDSFEFKADMALSGRLKKLAAETGTTLFMLLLAAFYILMNKHTRQEDMVIGTVVAGRPHPDLWKVMGMFVNTLPLRNYPKEGKTFREFLNEVRQNTLEAFENQDYPLEELISKLSIKRDTGRNSMLDITFIMQNIQIEELGESSLKFAPYNYRSKTTKFDLTLSAIETAEEIRLTFEYCTRLFKRETIERLADHYVKAINAIVENPETTLGSIELLDQRSIEEANSKILRAKNEIKNQIALSFDL